MGSESTPTQPPAPFIRTKASHMGCEYDLRGTPIVVQFECSDKKAARRVGFEAFGPQEWDEQARLQEMRNVMSRVLIAREKPREVDSWETRHLAYAYFEQRNREQRGTVHGHDKEDWNYAEQELKSGQVLAELTVRIRGTWYTICNIAVSPDAPNKQHLPPLLVDALRAIIKQSGAWGIRLDRAEALDPQTRLNAAGDYLGLGEPKGYPTRADEAFAKELGVPPLDLWTKLCELMQPGEKRQGNVVHDAIKRLPHHLQKDATQRMYQVAFHLGGD